MPCFILYSKDKLNLLLHVSLDFLLFIPIPKKGNAKECSNYHTIAFIPCSALKGETVPVQKAQGPGVCKLPTPPASRALCQAKRAPRAAVPSGCLAAQTERWVEGIRVPAPLARLCYKQCICRVVSHRASTTKSSSSSPPLPSLVFAPTDVQTAPLVHGRRDLLFKSKVLKPAVGLAGT